MLGVLAVYQAMLPLLREAPAARIVNVSSGVGSLMRNCDPAYPYRSIFGPVYPASKSALNAITLAMAIELESTGIKVNAACPGFTKTNLNNYAGTQTVEEGAREPVRLRARPGRPDRHILERGRTAPVVVVGGSPLRAGNPRRRFAFLLSGRFTPRLVETVLQYMFGVARTPAVRQQ